MAKANIWQWSETADSNTEINGNSLAENVMLPSGVNNSFREMMSQIITTEGKGTAVASAASLTLSGPERYFHITGSTGPIADIDFTDAVDVRWAWLIFDSTPTITHNGTTLQLPGNADIVAAAGDRMLIVQDASDNIICLVYQRAAVVPTTTGTFTPAFAATSSTFSYATQTGIYTRKGREVSGSIYLALNTSGNTLSAQPLSITGLPFAMSGITVVYFEVTWFQSTTSYIKIVAGLSSGATSLDIRGSTAATISGGGSALNANAALHATNGSSMIVNFCYTTA